jgi:hypothetical protein
MFQIYYTTSLPSLRSYLYRQDLIAVLRLTFIIALSGKDGKHSKDGVMQMTSRSIPLIQNNIGNTEIFADHTNPRLSAVIHLK